MTVYYPPESPPWRPDILSVFLAGSIEMGAAEEWQTVAIKALEGAFPVIFNPRRADWDSSWVQEASNPNFAAQVNWEIQQLELADCVLFHFDPNTKSPITLMELGYLAGRGNPDQHIYVSVPQGFWRRGNVEIMCQYGDFSIYESLSAALSAMISDWKKTHE